MLRDTRPTSRLIRSAANGLDSTSAAMVPDTAVTTVQRCRACDEIKSLGDFPKNRRRRNGIHDYCKSCHSKLERARYKRKVEDIRAARRLRRHGLTREMFDDLLRHQGGRCANCGSGFKRDQPPCVDHDPGKSKIRELLCNRCNLRIGMANHSVDVLLKDVIYLLKHSLLSTTLKPGGSISMSVSVGKVACRVKLRVEPTLPVVA